MTRYQLSLAYGLSFVTMVSVWGESPISSLEVAAQLRQPLLQQGQTWEEFRAFVEAGVPRFETPVTLAAWERQRRIIRQRLLDEVILRGQPAKWRDVSTSAVWFDEIAGGADYRIRPLAYEAVPGLWIPALLYEPRTLTGKVPVVINVNGHDREGKATREKQLRCINLAKRGMLALNVEFLGMGQLRDNQQRRNQHNRLAQLDLCGTSGLAPFYLTLERALDIVLQHPSADAERIGITGLSGGGWQTILLAALDQRMKLANPVAGYCSMLDAQVVATTLATPNRFPATCVPLPTTHI